MKKIPLSAIALIFAAGSANAATPQQAPWYVSLSGDLTWVMDTDVKGGTGGTVKYDVGGGGNIAAGYNTFNSDGTATNMRTELEAGYHGIDVDNANGHLRFYTIMANVYYDIPTSYGFTPFIGAGIGDSELYFSRDGGFGNTDDNDNSFAYQGMLGVSYTHESMPRADWFVSYHYLGIYKPQFDNIELESLNTNSVEVGVRYHF